MIWCASGEPASLGQVPYTAFLHWLRRDGQQRQRLIVGAGFAIIAVGVFCLCLSGMVADPGSWWQGTLDAFGVGFVVGGIIDVIALSGLNQVIAAEDARRREAERKALAILHLPENTREQAVQATDLLNSDEAMLLPSPLYHQIVRASVTTRRVGDPPEPWR